MPRFKLPELKYNYDGLEPYFDKETMKVHHTGHHQTYVDNANSLCSSLNDISLHDLLSGLFVGKNYTEKDKEIILKHCAGHYNHSLFWLLLINNSNSDSISQNLLKIINQEFGSFEKFKEEFKAAALKVFGSGWTWLVYDKETKKMYITSTSNQENPIMHNKNLVCLLTLDLWEHAYYLKFKSSRKTFIDTFWNVVNWEIVSYFYDEITLKSKTLQIMDDGSFHNSSTK